MIMKNVSIRNRIVRIFASVSAAAIMMLALPLCQARFAPTHQATVTAHHTTQIADGTESNGGKGGKGSSRVSGIA